jgi:hypothetical protein
MKIINRTIICKSKFDLMFMKNFIMKNNIKCKDFNIDLFIKNRQYPLVLYIYEDIILHSNLEYFEWRKLSVAEGRYEKMNLLDINILKRKEKLEKLNSQNG